ncbi:MAG: HK97 family phage prohead protease [Bacteroidota bacterium]
MPTFVLNDENVLTAHGFLVFNAGGKFDRFRENPVMLNSHDEKAVIGRWLNLTISGNKLQAETEFDIEDPDALKISGKVDRGFIRGASMGIIINDAEMRNMPGLGYVVVITDWELLEASPVGVPSNKSALRLYAKDGKTILRASEIKLSIDSIINQKHVMDKITLSVEAAKALGVSKDPEISELNASIMELSAKNAILQTAKEKAEQELSDHRTSQANELVELAVKEGRITADKKESFVKLATSDFKMAKDMLDSMPGKETFSDKTGRKSAQAQDRQGWNYLRWLKEDPKGLSAMQTNDPDGFAQLKAEYSSNH